MAADLTNRAVADAMGHQYDPSEKPGTQYGVPDYLGNLALLPVMLDWLFAKVGDIKLACGVNGVTAEHDWLIGVGVTVQRAVAALVVAVKEASA